MSCTVRRIIFSFLACAVALPTSAQAQGVLSPSAVTFERSYDVRTNDADTSYSQGLTHRYVNGELRFLSLTLKRVLQEWRLPTSGTQTATTATWNLSGINAFADFNGLWFEQAKNRLWIASTIDYNASPDPAKITIVTLGDNGTASVQKQFYLNVAAKRVYGGCQAVPATLVSRLGGPYVCGWGGYTSLLMNGGGASIGATMYVIPDPDTIANGSTVTVKTILDHAGDRGMRKTIPVNHYETNWQSPNSEGLGYMVWGDSYYNTGMWVGTSFVAVASLCKGNCWYENSTLHSDERQFELHIWDGSTLGASKTQRPSSMTELALNRGNDWVSEGDTPTTNIAGATYDATSGRIYLIGYTFGATGSTARLYSYVATAGAPALSDTQAPTVTLTAPAAGKTASGTVTLTASASDNVGVAGVWFTVDGNTIGVEDSNAPYSTTWATTNSNNGTHVLRAVARDAAGNTATSAGVTIAISNTPQDSEPPVVAISAPAAGSTVKGTVTVAAVATDNTSIAGVRFTLDGAALGAEDTSAPYSISWTTTAASNGTHLLRAVARDTMGNVTTSGQVSVIVNNTASDTTFPTVSLTSPSSGATVRGSIAVSATASDNVGIAGVQFVVDGAAIGDDTTAPYSITWNTVGATNGTHTLTAIARDASGNTRASAGRTVTVSNYASDVAAPALSISSPAANAVISGSVALTAASSDNTGVVGVHFAVDAVDVGAEDRSAPYSFTWNSAAVVNGPHTISATARDSAGNHRTVSVDVTVRNLGSGVAGDMNDDGLPDLVFEHANGQIYTWGVKNDAMIEPGGFSPVAVNPVWQIVGLDDFNGDKKTDLLWQNVTTGQVYVWFIDRRTLIGTVWLSEASTVWQVAGTGDFNGDGKADLLWWNPTTGRIRISLMDGASVLSNVDVSSAAFDPTWRVAGVADLDKNGRVDIVWQNRLTGALAYWFMNGTVVTKAGSLTPGATDVLWEVRAVADFNQDGQVDLLFQHATTGQLYIWHLNGTTLANGTYMTPGQVAVAWRVLGGR